MIRTWRWLVQTLPLLSVVFLCSLVLVVAWGSVPGQTFTIFLSLAYGFWRVFVFHPYYQEEYRQWLNTTPWSADKPLPWCPVSLVFQDLFVLVALWGLGTHFTPFVMETVLLPFMLAYLMLLAVTFVATGEGIVAYGLAFGFGLMAILWNEPIWNLLIMGGLYLLAWVGLHRSLKNFPWELRKGARFWSTEEFLSYRAWRCAGWPFQRLKQDVAEDEPIGIRSLTAVMMALLVGWWLYAVLSQAEISDSDASRFGQVWFWLIVATMLVSRVANYTLGYAPPLSLWGRLFTLRWIVPGYDKIFIAPVVGAIFLCCWVGYQDSVWGKWLLQQRLYYPIGISICLLIVTLLGPRLRTWRLTGDHAMVPNLSLEKQQYFKI